MSLTCFYFSTSFITWNQKEEEMQLVMFSFLPQLILPFPTISNKAIWFAWFMKKKKKRTNVRRREEWDNCWVKYIFFPHFIFIYVFSLSFFFILILVPCKLFPFILVIHVNFYYQSLIFFKKIKSKDKKS